MTKHCYAMTCKRSIALERMGSRSCAPHLAVVLLHKAMRAVFSERVWPYEWTLALMGLVYRKEDRERRRA